MASSAIDACYDRGAPTIVVFSKVSSIWDLSTKNWYGEKQNCCGMKNSMGSEVHDENHGKKKWRFSEDFSVKEPRRSENIFAKKRYTSIVACI